MGMGINEDVFQILPTYGDQPVLPAGQTVMDLKPGQIGVFDFHTNLSIDGTNAIQNKDFYLAVGIGSGDTSTDLAKSAGTHIQTRNLRAYTLRCYTPPQPKIVELTDLMAMCETDYSVKIEFRNGQIYQNYGFNGLSKTYSIRTGCCKECVDCPSGDCIELALMIRDAVNLDPDGLVIAELIDGPEGNVLATDEEIQAFRDANTSEDGVITACPGVRFTSQLEACSSYCGIPLNYSFPRGVDMIFSLLDFKCSGTLTTTQDLVYEEGSGCDLKWEEYFSGGWNGNPGPYRLLESGTATGPFRNLVKDEKYLQINISYDQFSTTGWREYENSQNTTVAIPCADTATRDALVEVLDAIFDLSAKGFGLLAETASACPGCDEVNTTSENGGAYQGSNGD